MRKKDKDAADAQDFTGMPAASRSLTPADIQSKEFSVSRFGGYRMRDVDEFLDQITESMTKLTDENQRLRSASGLPAAPSIGAPDLADTSRQADEIIESARAEAATIVQDARAQSRGRGDRRRGAGTDAGRAAVAPFLSQERDFLQQLATLVQSHAESVKGMAKASRAEAGAPPPAPPQSAAAVRSLRRSRAAGAADARVRLDAADARRSSPPRTAAPTARAEQAARRRRSAWRSRRRRPSAPATRTMTRDRARAATGRCGSCSGARSESGRPPCWGRPPLRRVVRPDPRRRGRVGRRAAGRRRPAAAGRGVRGERRRPAPVVARRRQALGVEAFRRLMPTV